MIVLVAGATGFIGSHLVRALRHRGHEVVCATRRACPDECHHRVPMDFAHEHDSAAWVPRLQGVDAVVNTVGIFQEQDEQTFEALHIRGPSALYEACVKVGITRVLQVSALGADEQADTPYHLSKKAGDDALLSLIPTAMVVQPSLVFGADGDSAQWFAMLASMPIIPVPAGEQWLQPIHVEDAVAAMVQLIEAPSGPTGQTIGQHVALTGPCAMTFRDYLLALRAALGLRRRALFIPIPTPLVEAAAWLGSRMSLGLLDQQSWRMLQRGSVGSSRAVSALLGAEPRPAEHFVAPLERVGMRALARWAWLRPVLELSLATVWIVTAVVSVWFFPVQDSLALLARSGVPPDLGPLMLYGAAGLDLLLGVAVLVRPGRRLWLAQMALMLLYTAIISWRLPEFWAHPYGPVLKNIPIFAMLLLLLTAEERP